MGGGDSGDGGASARQQAAENKKAEARANLNYLFGEGTQADLINRDKYFKTVTSKTAVNSPVSGEESPTIETTDQVFDQAAYDADVAASGKINPNKAARETLYSNIRDNAFTAGKRGLDETKEKAQRLNGFELFAKGLNGGSEDIDQNALMNRTYNQGLLDLGAKADATKTSFKSNDEQTRLGLLQSIDAGMDQSSALSSAINQMQNNANKSAADAQGMTLGNLFDTAGLMYQNSQKRLGTSDATSWWNTFNGNGTGKTNSTAASGLYTNT